MCQSRLELTFRLFLVRLTWLNVNFRVCKAFGIALGKTVYPQKYISAVLLVGLGRSTIFQFHKAHGLKDTLALRVKADSAAEFALQQVSDMAATPASLPRLQLQLQQQFSLLCSQGGSMALCECVSLCTRECVCLLATVHCHCSG